MEYGFCGRSLTITFVIFTYLGTWIGGGTIVGLVGNAYLDGASQYWIFGISCVAGVLFAMFFITRIRRLQVTGIADMLSLRFPEYKEFIRVPATLGLLIRNVTVVGMNFAAMSYMFTYFAGIDHNLATLLSLFLVVAYTVASGLWGVVVTDVLQGFIQTAGMLFLFFSALKNSGGLGSTLDFYERTDQLAAVSLIPSQASAPTILGFLFLFGLFFLMGDQSDWERIYSCKTDKTAFWGYLIPQSITLLLLLLPAFTGVLLRTLTNDVSDGYVLYWFVSQMISPQMTIFVILVIISSVLSSADSFMVASGVMFSGDIFHRFINPEAGDRELIFWTRVVAILAGSIGYAFAINMLDIMQLWSVGIGIAAVILLPAYFSAWFSRRVNTQGALAGMGTGIVYCASLVLTDASFSVGRVLLGFGLNVLATVVISLSTPPPAPEHVARTYYWAPHFHQTENPPDPSGQS